MKGVSRPALRLRVGPRGGLQGPDRKMERTASGQARATAAGAEAASSEFSEFDQNEDGEVDLDELFRVFSARLGFTREQSRQVMAAIDTDGDGRLSAAEFAAWQAEQGAAADLMPSRNIGTGPSQPQLELQVTADGDNLGEPTSSMSRQTSTSELEPVTLDTTPRPDIGTAVDLSSEASSIPM